MMRARWAWIALGSVAGSIAAVVLALHSLSAPLLKHRLQAAARDAAGIELDYSDARIDVLSGLAIDHLEVRSPRSLQAFAPTLIRIGRVRVLWSVRALLTRRQPALESVEIDHALLTVVIDEHGRTSFDAWLGDRPPSPSVPLSKKPGQWLASAAAVARVELADAALAWVHIDHGEEIEHGSVQGLAGELRVSGAARERHASLVLGTQPKPLMLSATRATVGVDPATAHAQLWASADLSARQLTAAGELHMREQSFVSVAAERWLHAEARASFDAAAGRTQLTLARADAADGALQAEGELEIPDAGAVLLRHARGEVDLARLLRWLPEGLVPMRAQQAEARFDVTSLVLATPPRLSSGGTVALDGDLADVALSAPHGPLTFRMAQVALHASPDATGRYAGKGSLKAQRMRFGDMLAADDVVLDATGELAADGGMSGRVDARLGHASFAAHGGGVVADDASRDSRAVVRALTSTHDVSAPAARAARYGPAETTLTARDAHIELRAAALHPDGEHTRGELTLAGELAALDLAAPAGPVPNAHAGALALHAHTLLSGSPPYSASFGVDAAQLSASDAAGKVLADAPARIEGRVRELRPDLQQPAATSGEAHLALALGDVHAELDAHRHDDALDFDVGVDAGSLHAARPFLASELQTAAPWDAMALSFQSRGRIDHPLAAQPALRHQSQLHIQHFGLRDISADALTFTLASHGTALRHALELDARAQGLAWRNVPASDDHLRLTAAVDREHRSLQAHVTSEGRARTQAQAALSFDIATHVLRYDIDAQLSGLAPLAPLLSRLRGLGTIDPTQLEVSLSSHGTLSGVIAELASDGSMKLAPNPERTALALGKNDLKLTHLVWSRGNLALATPELRWRTQLGGSSERRTLNSELDLGTLHIERAGDDIDLNGVAHHADAVIAGNLLDPEVEVTQHLDVRAVQQGLVPEYPLGDVRFAMSAEGGRNGVLHISELTLANGAAGTQLALNGNVDLSEGHRTLSVTTSFTQDLSRISGTPGRWQGRGKLAVEAHVTSPDFARYRVRAAVKGDDVSLQLARAGVELQHASGEVPVAVSLEVGAHGVTFERSDKRNPYSMLRFADQHPLLTRSGFVSIGTLKTPFASIAPLVGNLEIEQNVISLRQFEMGVRGGTITGQCGLDLNGPNSTLELHVRANGVRSSHGEPFDGNIAVAMSAADRSIDGRAEILRIGERHLLDLLDLQDPLHVDAAMNRIRSALAWGYPKTLRLTFDHGFASAHLELGGLAKFLSISDVRGIPMGPIVDKMLARALDASELKEMP